MNQEEKQSIDNKVLKQIREELNMSQAEFAARLGTDQSKLSKIERGVLTPPWLIKFIALSKMVEETGKTWQDILLDSSPPTLRTAEKTAKYSA